ncbi:MAG: hypothetical protein JST08_17445 [Actinobacteria bacterium]|nr:hypothetical protein [Actinomycetota bacterium]
MAQILVLTESSEADGEVIYSENVASIHLEGHAGAQLVERLRWAVRDAQVAEHRAMLRPATTGDAERPTAA